MTSTSMTHQRVWIGVDVGTSMAKAAAFDVSGELLAVASRPVPLSHPGQARVEQDPEVIVGSVQAVLAEVCAAVGNHRPELVALTGQGDGCWLFDASGVPVRTAISWMDGRAASILAEWEENGTSDAMFAENGNIMFPGAPAPILAWLDRNEPEVLDRAATAGYIKDLLLQRFTGVRATDATDASLPFGSLTAGEDYSAEVLRLTGLTHRAGLLAPIQLPLPSGTLTVGGAGATTLVPGTPILAAPYDIPACVIGSGMLEPGDGLLIAGTTLACSVLTDEVDLSGPKAGMTITMPQPDRWLRVMAAMVGTASLDWALKILDVPFSSLNALLEDTAPGSNGVEVLPFLAPSGERAPFVDPAARAQFTGLSLTSTRGDMIRALCEGLAYSARSCFEAAGLTGDVYICGGGSRSIAWMQIFASVLGRPVFLAKEGEVGARGAILAAAEAIGAPLDAEIWTGPHRVVEPDATAVKLYAAGYDRFGRHLSAAKALWMR
ncbi:sugar (pentulose or hexulose) kinase [Nakamurella sp. UYEF19]|uniref:FGGY-family carbohydrate kinase n=1 Tax=Nakamurella sp. UYEF19 TaxID=1756392 RepID=UPI003395C272